MLNKLITKKTGGFTLVEIMIVVAIIALLAAVAVPSFLRARKRSQAIAVKTDLRLIDSAVDQYALENNRAAGFQPSTLDVSRYLKSGTRLHDVAQAAGASGTALLDLLGGSIGIPTVDSLPRVPAVTNTALSDVADPSFWVPFPIGI